MSKTMAGCVLVGGLVVAAIAGMIASDAASVVGHPSTDTYYEIIQYVGTAVALAGLAAFGYGSLIFARR